MDIQPMFFKDCSNCATSTVWTTLRKHDEHRSIVECDQCETQEIVPTTIHEDALDG